MKIGELSKTSGTSIETIRYYESEGLLPAAARTESNYRIYGPQHADRLSFIRHCRSLDMALGEIRTLLEFKDAPLENCASVNQLLDDHIGHVATRIRELKALERQLRALREQCQEAQSSGSCGILRGLSTATALPQAEAKAKRQHVHGSHR
jgi:Cd(II)/Pb(II)-responsive transcriptional regulator